MARKSRPLLSESWGTVDGEDDSNRSTSNVQDQTRDSESPSSASVSSINMQEPLRRSSRKQTPSTSIQRPAAETIQHNLPASTEPSFVMPSIHQPQHRSVFNALPEAPSTPKPRYTKHRVSRTDKYQVQGSSDPRRESSEPLRRRRTPRRQKQPLHTRSESHEPQLFEGIARAFLWPIVKLVWQTIANIFGVIVPWIPILVAAWAVFGLFYFSINFAFLTASNALSPLCNIPVVAWYWSGFCDPRLSPPSAPREFEELIELQSTFEEVLSSSTSAGINSLPMDITRGVLHLGELRHNVRVSQLPSKNELVLELESFDESANDASSRLGSFSSSIGRAVDKIITTNRWTLRKLDSIANSDSERGLIERFKNNIMSPFKPRVTRYDEIMDQYLKHTDVVEEQITDLILEAQALVKALQMLDNQLDAIAFITKRDGVDINVAKDDLLAQLWTFFGGNRHEVKQLDRKLALIQDLSRYRQLAVAHVLATIRKLEGIQNGLKDLRLRIIEPRLDLGKRDMPLEWHIYNIQLGLERLEQQKRDSNRALGEDLNRFYEGRGGKLDQSRMIEGKMGKAYA